MFHLTRKTDYGLILMLELSQQAGPVSLRDIAKKYCISFFFLQKIAKILREKGLIEAERGKNGGYKTMKSIEKISVREIFEALEEEVEIISCFKTKMSAPILEKKCQMPVHKGLSELNARLQNLLENTTLKNFIS